MIYPTHRCNTQTPRAHRPQVGSRGVSFFRWPIAKGLHLVIVLLPALSLGCASNRYSRQAEVDAMRREYFELEDRFYELEGRYRRAERRLRQEGVELDSLGAEDEASESSVIEDRPTPVSPEDDIPMEDPSLTPMPEADPMPQEDSLPELPGPENADRSWRRPPSSPAESRLSSRFRRPNLPNANPADDRQAAALEDDSVPWTETNQAPLAPINDWEVVSVDVPYVRGYNSDGNAGDDGIFFMVEPRNAAGQLVPAVAPMTIALIDPQAEGEAQRIGLWDLTAEEIAATQQEDLVSGQGITLRLPWQGEPPSRRQFVLFVRYGSVDEAPLEARTNVTLQSGSGDRSTWLPRPTPLRTAEPPSTRPDRVASENGGFSSRPSSSPSVSSDAPLPRPTSNPPGAGTAVPRTSRPAWSPYR